jgi:uncharacterized membrane protein YqgA involved in biofilm formation
MPRRSTPGAPAPAFLTRVTGTWINVAAILAGTLAGTLVGSRLRPELQQRVMAGLGLVTLVLGVDNALEWQHTNPIIVFGGVLLGGLAGELIGIERRLGRLGDAAQRRFSSGPHSRVSEGFVTTSLLFCVGPLAVIGSIQGGLTGDYDTLASKAMLDGFAAIAFASTLGWGVGLSAISVLIYQGVLTLGAGMFEGILSEGSEPLAALVSAGGILIIGISLKLLGLADVRVGNFLPALVFAPALVGLVSVF